MVCTERSRQTTRRTPERMEDIAFDVAEWIWDAWQLHNDPATTWVDIDYLQQQEMTKNEKGDEKYIVMDAVRGQKGKPIKELIAIALDGT